ncbi:phage scaffolding protein [Caproicibacterium amylolyticum]|uniref:Phage scaffolding protein n=1 Tax=Caproicibacterium amylolyticum TaxID=2766537 RepID=A0A7G9WF88_9FIRM|nr:phage scaffolding protein [Caproicibacterium amylolyticum]QNO17350.1 phage scaffolding protein [Caproicibacterium amylolyticum]
MERKFLTGLGLEKDVIDKILDQNGAETTALRTQLKTKDTEISTLRTDLTTANDKVADLEKVDTAGLQGQLDAEKAGRKKDRQGWNLKAALTSANCKDADYIMFKLGDTVEFADDGSLKDKDKLLETCKKDYATMFDESKPPETQHPENQSQQPEGGIRLASGGEHGSGGNTDYDSMSDDEYYAATMKKDK